MRLTVSVVGTFHGRHENTGPLIRRVLDEAVRRPDEFWILCEDEADLDCAQDALDRRPRTGTVRKPVTRVRLCQVPTPRAPGGGYWEIPYSRKLNHALDNTSCALIVYLDNGSMPHPDKVAVMADALEQHPDWGAVYCGQKRTGYQSTTAHAKKVVADGYCAVNYTQVMHRLTPDRWTLDMRHANPDLADGIFWRSLHRTLGPFHPVSPGHVLDDHHMEAAHATGVQ